MGRGSGLYSLWHIGVVLAACLLGRWGRDLVGGGMGRGSGLYSLCYIGVRSTSSLPTGEVGGWGARPYTSGCWHDSLRYIYSGKILLMEGRERFCLFKHLLLFRFVSFVCVLLLLVVVVIFFF